MVATGSPQSQDANGDTASRLLDAAQRMIQQRGYNAFSYHDLAAEVGIRTASIHYHFKAKADLGQALIRRYLDNLDTGLAELDQRKHTDRGRLRGFIEAYRKTGQDEAICLCGSMAADLVTLTPGIHQGVVKYLERSEKWVKAKIDSGRRAGEFGERGGSGDLAQSLLSGLQGALLVTRARQDGGAGIDRVEKVFFLTLEANAA